MSRIEITPTGRRLFVADGLDGRVYVLAATLQEARLRAAGSAPASDKQVRDFLSELALETTRDLVSRLDVSRQTLHHWRRRAGLSSPPDLVTRRFGSAAILEALRAGASIVETARAAGCSESTARRIAREANVRPAKARAYPFEEELVDFARGKNWTEIAAILGRSENAARAWIYARPELARAVRAVMVRRAPGRKVAKC